MYEELQIKLLKLLQDNWSRVISLDVETHVPDPNHFLKGERILSISLARRVSGNFMEEGIKPKTFFLDRDEDDSEKKLLENLNRELSVIKPLGVIGYGLRQYDIPLLIMKKQQYKILLWKLVDMTESAVHIDLYHILKYRGCKKLDDVLSSPEFSSLPLRRTHGLLSLGREEKGRRIYQLWRENREKLKEYSEGEVHDVLLIAEKLMFEEETRPK
ncbi:MAG: hypothetical protein QW356_08205 [Candidatus Hadarchaeales archaeon]